MKKQVVLLMSFVLFFTVAFSQEKEVILNSDMKAEIVEALLESDTETDKELKEARGDYVHWFKVSEFIMTLNEESDLYGLQEVQLPEVDLESIIWINEEETESLQK